MALTYTEAQIQSILDSVSGIADDVSANANDIETLDTTVNELSGTVGEQATSLEALSTKVDETFQSVSSGKSLVASAITDKGVETESDATFQQMATNIANIKTGSYVILETLTSSKTYRLENNKTYYVATMMNYTTSQVNYYQGYVKNGSWYANANGYRSTSYNQYVLPNMVTYADYCNLTINPMNSNYPTHILIAEVVS